MFTFDTYIDAVQNGKKQMVKAFVVDKTMAETLNKFVDAQTEYTKSAVKAGTDTVTTLTQTMIKSFKDSTQFDYSKFGEGIMKAYQANFSK